MHEMVILQKKKQFFFEISLLILEKLNEENFYFLFVLSYFSLKR